MKIHKYDGEKFDPPAAVVKMTLYNETTGDHLPGILMQLDTGADISLIPQSAVTQLGIQIDSQQISLTNFDGEQSSSPLAQVKLQIERYIFRGSFPVVEREIGIIGRDILNLLPILFDGPNQEWKVMR